MPIYIDNKLLICSKSSNVMINATDKNSQILQLTLIEIKLFIQTMVYMLVNDARGYLESAIEHTTTQEFRRCFKDHRLCLDGESSKNRNRWSYIEDIEAGDIVYSKKESKKKKLKLQKFGIIERKILLELEVNIMN